MRKLNKTALKLFDYAQTIPVIDTHEHFPQNEKEYLATPITFGELFIPYITNDLYSSGMPFGIGDNMRAAPFHFIEDDWDILEPFWNNVKFGSYARSLRIALKKYYDVEDLTRENYKEVLKKINENHNPDIFKKVLKEDCNIKKVISCRSDISSYEDNFVLSNVSTPALLAQNKGGIELMLKFCTSGKNVTGSSDANVTQISNLKLDEFIELGNVWMEKMAKNGAIEFKCRANPVSVPDKEKAEAEFQRVLNGDDVIEWDTNNICAYILEANAKKAAELNLPIALHTGVWHDFRNLDIRDTLGVITRNPDTKFDLYHLGIPAVRTALQIVKNFPNAYLNLCWAHIVAPEMLIQTMKESIDMIPLNKVFAFGGDYLRVIERVYGHLHIAKENIAIVLGDRVDTELMDFDTAKETMLKWFYTNPASFYGIE